MNAIKTSVTKVSGSDKGHIQATDSDKIKNEDI